jgi:hypothetical protein
MSIRVCPSCFPALTPDNQFFTVHVNMDMLASVYEDIHDSILDGVDVPAVITVLHAGTCVTGGYFIEQLRKQHAKRKAKPKAQ